MRRFFCIPICFLLISGFSFSGNEPHSFRDKDLHVDYQVHDGLLNGHYVSWYRNGKKKTEGEFRNNLRTGVWEFWDSTGKLVTKQIFGKYNHLDGYNTTVLFPEQDNAPRYVDEDVPTFVTAKKVWRFLPYEKSNPLFEHDRLYNSIVKLLDAKEIDCYDSSYAVIDVEKVHYPPIDGKPYRLVGYRTCEDLDFGEYGRIFQTGMICAVVKNLSTQKDSDLTWVSLEILEDFLTQVKLSPLRMPYFKTLDDVLDQQYFKSEIYREKLLTYSGWPTDKTKEVNVANAEKEKLELVELESDCIARSAN